MSNSENRPLVNVIVRAWGDEPVRLSLYRLDRQTLRAYVGGGGPTRPIGLPFNQVFGYDAGVWDSLTDAFRSSDFKRLGRIYADLEENKRIDILIPVEISSLHGQEHVAHSRSVTTGSSE